MNHWRWILTFEKVSAREFQVFAKFGIQRANRFRLIKVGFSKTALLFLWRVSFRGCFNVKQHLIPSVFICLHVQRLSLTNWFILALIFFPFKFSDILYPGISTRSHIRRFTIHWLISGAGHVEENVWKFSTSEKSTMRFPGKKEIHAYLKLHTYTD